MSETPPPPGAPQYPSPQPPVTPAPPAQEMPAAPVEASKSVGDRLQGWSEKTLAKADERQKKVDNAHGNVLPMGTTLGVSEDGKNGTITFEQKGLQRERKKVMGKTDRHFIPYASIGSVAHNRRTIGRDSVAITISGQTLDWKIAKDAEGFVNALNLIIVGDHPELQSAAPGPAPAAPIPAAAPPVDVVSQLKELAGLKDAGVLTQEEFDAQKAKLLG